MSGKKGTGEGAGQAARRRGGSGKPSGGSARRRGGTEELPEGPAQGLAAELTWTGERFEREVVVEVADDGRIVRVCGAGEAAEASQESPPPLSLPGRALLPGFVDAHSHAFQRGLRGRGQLFPAGGRETASFWSWRREMYRLVETVTPERLHALCLAAFREMRAAGITAVGEFHYLHHEDAGARDHRFDEVVVAAAAEAPIRIVLLSAFYRTGGIGRALAGAQLRFATPGVGEYLERLDRLAARLDGPLASLGVVAHSIRAATPREMGELLAEARRRGLPFHLHLEEQRREIAEAIETYGRRPMKLLLERLDGNAEGVTAVHCTHTEPDELSCYLSWGGRICICPTTEADLGDGIPPLAEAGEEALGRLCLGTDSNLRISMLEEMRWLEHGQRLAGERRGVLAAPASEAAAPEDPEARGDGEGAAGGEEGRAPGPLAGVEAARVGPVLLAAATRQGARSLHLPAGELTPGHHADLALVDLSHPALAFLEEPEETLADALAFGCGDEVIAATAVAGRWVRHR